jgi:hypothetical protein
MTTRKGLWKWLAAIAVAAAVAWPIGVLGASHALIMTIDAYEGPSKLPGVALDTQLAVEMAKRMGIPAENTVVRRNRELTLSGMREAMKSFEARVGSGDQVFVYYSGHGARIRNPNVPSGCTAAMVAVRGELLPDTEVADWVTNITRKAERLVFMNDSCFSAGVATRGARAPEAPAGYLPKYHKTKGAEDCGRPFNVRTFFMNPEQIKRFEASSNPRALFIAASAENEVSYAGPVGSVGTLAWLDCLASIEKPERRGKPLTAQELVQCSQKVIDEDPRNPPQIVTVIGNRETTLSFSPARR